MSIADELRRDADAALREDGMYYSGEYLDGIAKRVEEVEDENAKLRELVRYAWDVALHPQLFGDGSYLLGRMRDLGIEVD